ncbi:uncharacterized protein LOC119445268 [Dermacentor silvarum]|uniref:uncharacterized protein LOC119445268 n=1 Tax=Dermacentor silvarum TaxID=543639 RepID=UPI001897DF5D|nr:uncharacterized protein LOC119445268 [Dermacentor silvarum]
MHSESEQPRLGIVHVHCTCFRSQKKSGRPYNVQLSVQSATGVPRTTTCECPAGKSGACSHILAAVRLLALLKQQGFAEPPPELSCTELPQQWRRPRQKGIKPASVLDVDWRAPREGGVQLPVTARLSDASLDYQDEASQVAAIQSLGAELESLGDFPFAAVLLDVQAPLVKTKAGLAPADSPLTYQQSDRPHDFKTWMSSTIAPGAGTSCAVPRLALFTGAVQHTFPDVLTVDEQQILMHLQLAPEEAQDLEVNTRQQALSDRWHSARHHRLTASTFGRVIKRKEWTEKGLRNLLDPKDLSRVRAIQYGKKNESVAAERYATTMRAAGHNVTLQHCGLAVHPSCPWLGASPDRLAFDPEEGTYGVVEIKCPYSLKDSEANTVTTKNFCLTFVDDTPQLKRDDEYFYQVLGQMAVTECQWADFVVFSEKWIAVERIYFDQQKWDNVKAQLDDFFFTTALPYFAARNTAALL